MLLPRHYSGLLDGRDVVKVQHARIRLHKPSHTKQAVAYQTKAVALRMPRSDVTPKPSCGAVMARCDPTQCGAVPQPLGNLPLAGVLTAVETTIEMAPVPVCTIDYGPGYLISAM